MINNRFKLAVRILPLVIIVVLLKFLVHYYNWEFLTLNNLFTAIISANIFLIGFLLSGVMSDYKESEKIPTDIASAIETIADEGKIVAKKDPKTGKDLIIFCKEILKTTKEWFENKRKTAELMEEVEMMNDHFMAMEKHSLPNYIARLKGEQHFIRKSINRAHTIKDTDFIGTGYTIAEIITLILIFGFIFIKMEPFYESMFFISFVSFMLIYMIKLIKDLDNPFSYGKTAGFEDVSLKPFDQTIKRLDNWLKNN
ncbi:MAG: hypothetical protein PHW52_00690 [Candidatus Pacebacteria bacterium]|nr:hypothetical protein [Candidatus Paceibacterota bacterium]